MTEFVVEFEFEDDGRWIAAVPELSGVLAYCSTQEEAREEVVLLGLSVMQATSSSSQTK
ncbi:MAG: hypothetical protein ABSF70_00925 [Terracidiphilus sp.]